MTVFRRDDAEVGQWIAGIATHMHERAADISASVYRGLGNDIPELRALGPANELLGASVRENIDTLLHALQHDIPPARIHLPTAAVEYTRRLAQRDTPVTALARAYHVGQWRLTELFFAELETVDLAPADRTTVAEALTTRLFAYLDQVIQQVIVTYQHERELWLEAGHSMRAVRVREVLEGERAVDADEATASIRYPLHWYHLALVVWYSDVHARSDDLARLQRFVQESAKAAGAGMGPLVVADDRSCAWAWLPFRSAQPQAVARVRDFAARYPDAPQVTIGTPASGVSGFRRSHQLAQRARSVALAREDTEPRVIAADDPGVSAAALLGNELSEVRQWVGEVLGDLAIDNDNNARLRETLRIFLLNQAGYKAAAAELDLHFNTVKYRIERAVSQRGRGISEDRLDVELALLICYWYGPTVLRPDTT